MVLNYFHILLDFICQYIVEDFCVKVYDRYQFGGLEFFCSGCLTVMIAAVRTQVAAPALRRVKKKLLLYLLISQLSKTMDRSTHIQMVNLAWVSINNIAFRRTAFPCYTTLYLRVYFDSISSVISLP